MIPIMLASGSIMRWFEPWPVQYRTGATFVHDWTAIATWAVVAGHILFALNDGESLRGMLTGRVSRTWARSHHPRWAAEEVADEVLDEEPEAARVGDGGDHPLR